MVQQGLWSGPTVARVWRNSGWLLVERATRLLLALVIGAWIARQLGPAQFGELTYVLALLAFFQATANLGLDSIVVRNLSREPDSAPDVLGSVFVARLAIGAVAWLCAVGSASLMSTSGERIVALIAVAGATVLLQAGDTVDLWFQSRSQSRRTVLVKLVASAVSGAIRVALLLLNAPLIAFAAALSIEAACIAIGMYVAYRRSPTERPWNFRPTLLRQLLREGWPLLASAVAVMVYMRIDQILIRDALGERALGVYAAALSISHVWHFLPGILTVSLLPVLVIDNKGNPELARQRLVMVFRCYFAAATLISLCVSLAAPLIIRILYGAHYEDAAAILRVHVFSNVFIFLGVAHSMWLTNEGKSGVRLVGTAIAGSFSVLANYWLLPLYGLTAAAATAIGSQFIAAVGINFFMARESFWMQLDAVTFAASSKRRGRASV